jgi:hypothetical protein
MGNSEGLMVLFVLGAVDRHLAGDRRAAFGLGVLAALLRPEAWPFLAAYGLWTMWRRHLSPTLVLGAGAAVLALWVLPEWWGSGDLLRAAHRAKDVNAGAPTFADSPVIALLEDAGMMLTIPLWVGLAAAGVLAAVLRRRATLGLALLGLAWLALVAYMTKDGFSGNQRYLIVPICLFIVLAGAGIGQLLSLVAARLGRPLPLVGGAVAIALVGVAFVLPNAGNLGRVYRAVEYQARLTDELPSVIQRAGGAAALRRCGPAHTGPFLVPAVAWNLGVHTSAVQLAPGRPGVAFREVTSPGRRAVPSLRGMAGVPAPSTLAVGELWRIVAVCGPAS